MAWSLFDVTVTLPTEVTTLIGLLNEGISALTSLQDLQIKGQDTATSKLSVIGAELSSKEQLLKATLQSVSEGLNALLAAGKVHIMYVPIHKPIAGSNKTVLSTVVSDPILTDDNKRLYSYVKDAPYVGNRGFYRQVLESITDVGDPSRPAFEDDDYIGCQVLLVGEGSLAKALTAARVFDRLFSANKDTFSSRMVPVPQNLKARVIGMPTGPAVGVRLDWDALAPTHSPKYYPISFSPKRIAIIRSTNKQIVSASTVTDLFGTSLLKKGLKSPDTLSEVVAVLSPGNASYVDTAALDTNTVYYYATAVEVTAVETTTTTVIPFERLSNVAKVVGTTIQPAPPSQKPDWVATPSPVELLPALASVLTSVKEQLDILANRQNSLNTTLTLQKDLLQQAVTKHTNKINLIRQQVATLSATLEASQGVYHAAFTGQGGMNLFTETLYSLLFDTTDTTRPPYDGNQFVLGLVVLYGGKQVDIQPIHDLLELFLGGSSTNPVTEALTSIDAFIDAEEAVVFGPDLQPLPSSTLETTDPLTGETVSTIDPLTGRPAVTNTTPVIGVDGTPVSTSSPDNPNQGYTNKKDITC